MKSIAGYPNWWDVRKPEATITAMIDEIADGSLRPVAITELLRELLVWRRIGPELEKLCNQQEREDDYLREQQAATPFRTLEERMDFEKRHKALEIELRMTCLLLDVTWTARKKEIAAIYGIAQEDRYGQEAG